MHTERQDREQVTVVMDAVEARWVLDTLRELGAAAGSEGEALADALERAGVVCPEAPDHERNEYMPPKD